VLTDLKTHDALNPSRDVTNGEGLSDPGGFSSGAEP
jgi:hypothetical protein